MSPERKKVVLSAVEMFVTVPHKLAELIQLKPKDMDAGIVALADALPTAFGITVEEVKCVLWTAHLESHRKMNSVLAPSITPGVKIPGPVPTGTFYHHYKHDPSKGARDYAYELIGVGVHTEDDCRPEDVHMVVYRPLYVEAEVFKAGKLFDLRPLEMWMGNVVVGDESVPRFQQVLDPTAIAELARAREEMYGEQ